MWGPQTKQPVHLMGWKPSQIARWSEYFQKLLNVPRDIEPEAMENIHQLSHSVNTALDKKPTMDEMVRVIKRLKDG